MSRHAAKKPPAKLPAFAERFRELRGDMSQDDFAKFVDISRPTVGFYENGERLPDALVIRKICNACKVSSDWLLGLNNVRSTDISIVEVCKVTGLTEKAVCRLMADKTIVGVRLVAPVINALLETRIDCVATSFNILKSDAENINAMLGTTRTPLLDDDWSEEKEGEYLMKRRISTEFAKKHLGDGIELIDRYDAFRYRVQLLKENFERSIFPMLGIDEIDIKDAHNMAQYGTTFDGGNKDV